MAKATAPAAEAQPAARAITPAVERPASHDATEIGNHTEAEFFSSAARHVGLATGGTDNSRPLLRAVINHINRYCMVPAFRLGLAPILGTPLGGYIMVLKTRGRKSGRLRYAPLNYAILDGCVYCIAGWGRETHWFANLKAEPHVELLLPGGAIAGIAEEVADPQEAQRAAIRVARNSGFAVLFGGLNPLSATDEQLLAEVEYAPVVRIRPYGVGSGAFDPGEWGWVLPLLLQLAGFLWIVRRARAGRSHRHDSTFPAGACPRRNPFA